TQDQYIGLDLGPFALIGSAPDNLDRFVETRAVSAAGQAMGVAAEIPLSGRNAYENSFTLESVQEFSAAIAANPGDLAAAAGLLEVAQIGLVKPERVQAIELGYRSVINN